MTLQVEVTYRETIKPSLPTPQHLRNFQLSLIDQYLPLFQVPIILFYAATEEIENAKTFNRLKASLSETLTRFYPFAGRIIDNYLLECNDNGVDYFETQVRGQLNQVLSCPRVADLAQLAPGDILAPTIHSKPLLAVQVNKFDCGGMAIAICISHKISDAATLCTFANSWATTAKGSSKEIVFPTFVAATLFPPRQVSSVEDPPENPINKIVCQRFLFESSNIYGLKAKVSNTSFIQKPTSMEAVMGLLWRCGLKNSKLINPSKMNFLVNLRRKLNPPLPEYCCGNLIVGPITSSVSENGIDLQSLVGKLKETKEKVDKDFVKEVPLDDVLAGYADFERDTYIQYLKGEVELYTFTSWCRFPFYEADFGWGKPIWTSCVNPLMKNMVTLMDTKSGDGIEAWVSLDEQDMAKFECDEELLAYTSPIL